MTREKLWSQLEILTSPLRHVRSAALEEQDGDLAQVEVDEMPGLVGHVGAEVPAHDAVPGGVVLLVELLLDEGGDVLLDVVLLESLKRFKVSWSYLLLNLYGVSCSIFMVAKRGKVS